MKIQGNSKSSTSIYYASYKLSRFMFDLLPKLPKKQLEMKILFRDLLSELPRDIDMVLRLDTPQSNKLGWLIKLDNCLESIKYHFRLLRDLSSVDQNNPITLSVETEFIDLSSDFGKQIGGMIKAYSR